MDLARELVLERREEIDQLVRLVAAARVTELTVDHFLEDEMARRVVIEVRCAKEHLEVRHVAMQVARNNHLGAVLQLNDVPMPARSRPHQRERLPKVGQHSFRCGQCWVLFPTNVSSARQFTNIRELPES
jgi:hypothetical protein